ncbi:MAG: S8 family serine peptidase, partial [Actinobacteria bacterium]|nr:S8 family serine peptidase [Actinomycetota bacterium]
MRARTRTLTALLPAVAVILTAGLAAAPPAAAVPAASDPAAGRLLVQYKTDTTVETKTSLERANGLAQVKKLDRIGVEVVKTRPGNEDAAIAALQRSGRVVFAERDGRTTAAAVTPNDPWWPQQWSPVKVNAPQAWSVTTGSSTVVVAVLDTGVTSHPDLAGKLTAGYDFINNDSSPVDDNGHGTLAAGVVGALSNNGIGVASLCWQCKIMPVKVLDAAGSGSYSELANGIVWAADRGAKVISMSLSGVDDSTALRSAVQYARNKGAVLTSAAGNDGCDCRSFPASFPEVISVGASSTTDARTSYSNYGSWVDVAAPGTNYTTTMSGAYASFTGTSSSTPVVAGVLGLLRSAAPSASVDAIETALLSSASPVGYVAAGRIDAAAAMSATVPTVTSFPVSGPIGAMYPSVAGVLGEPTSVEYDVPGGRGQSFQAGDMLWSTSTGAREVHGPIVVRYRGIGGPGSSLGLPTTHDSPAGDGVGRFNHFQGGTIIWGPASGAHDVRGGIRARWAQLGWEKSGLGYPVTGDSRAGDGVG